MTLQLLRYWTNATIPHNMKNDVPGHYCFVFKQVDKGTQVIIKFQPNDTSILERLKRVLAFYHDIFRQDQNMFV
jgi:hypothetical protein